jgi:hypothetical protein
MGIRAERFALVSQHAAVQATAAGRMGSGGCPSGESPARSHTSGATLLLPEPAAIDIGAWSLQGSQVTSSL